MNFSVNFKLSRSRLGFLICMVMVLTLLGGYYFYWTKTPEYSLKLIQEAIKNHDLEKFKKHVDMDTLVLHVVDDVFIDSVNKVPNNKENNIFATGFLQLVKPNIINSIKEKIADYVENGSDKKSISDNQKVNDKNIALTDKAIDKKLQYSSFEFKEITYSQKDGKVATVGIKLWDKHLEESFVLDVKMRELQDGTWQVIELANLKDCLVNVEKAKYAYYSTPPNVVKALQIVDSEYKDEICTLTYPKVEIAENRQAEQKINSIIQEKVNKAIERGKSLKEMEKPRFGAYSVKLNCKTLLNDGKFFSVVLEQHSYTGGAHGLLSREGLLFDAKTGDKLQWTDVYPEIDDVRKAKINQTILQQSKDKKITIFTPFRGIKTDKSLNFYVNENYKPVIIFQPYQMAPFSSGILEFDLPAEVYRL